jgi:hypothetical protein
VNGWDPTGLLEAGGSRDEYDSIVDKLLGLLSTNASRDDVIAFLEREVREQFGTPARDVSHFAAKAIAWFRMAPANLLPERAHIKLIGFLREGSMAGKAPRHITWVICLILYIVAVVAYFGVVRIDPALATWSWIIGYAVLLIAVQAKGL